MMKKDGKIKIQGRDDAALKAASILNSLKNIPEKNKESETENDQSFSTSLNEELDELLTKNKGRFFGGCGG